MLQMRTVLHQQGQIMDLFIAINENCDRRECGIFIQRKPGGDGFFLGSFDYDEAIKLHHDLERINAEIFKFAENYLKRVP